MKLNKSTVDGAVLPAGKSDVVFWDDDLPGFGLRLRGTRKTWLIQFRVAGKQGRESLGDIRRIPLDDARKIARQRFATIELGVDPRAARAAAKTAAAAAQLTLGSIVTRYLAYKESTLRPSTYRAAVRHFGVHWAPFRDRPLDTIRRADVALRLQELTKNGRVGAARARSNLSALFGWAMGEGLCEQNPVLGTNDPNKNPIARERVLSDSELAIVWHAAGGDDFGHIVRLLMLTGCRRIEIGHLRWDELDFDAGVLRIPGTRAKNHRDLILPLPAAALDILRVIPRADGSTHVFRGEGFNRWGAATAALRARIAATKAGANMAHFVLHDLRRTARTGMGRLGVQPHIAELVIGHAKAGLVAVYDRYRYEREIGQALALWSDHVLAVVEKREAKLLAFPA